MIAFIIKSTLSLALLLAVYYLALQREKMYMFNRFYLLFAICFSLIIPFIQIETSPEALPFPQLGQLTETVTNSAVFIQPGEKPASTINWPALTLWAIYIAGALMMLYRFSKNLWQILSTIRSNPVIREGNNSLVLLDQPVMPHSFLQYIFINRTEYEHKNIEQELLQHESTHIRQRHSLDILLIECLRIIFWFNPLFFFYRKAIKLNHEFLADDAVLRVRNDIGNYQQLLLNKIFMNKASGLASHVHYSLTKKRLIMMTKSTSFLRALALQLAMVPLFTILGLLFCTKMLAQVPQKPQPAPKPGDPKSSAPVLRTWPWSKIKNQDSLRAVKERYYSATPGAIYSFRIQNDITVKKHWHEMTQEEKEHVPPPPGPPERMYVTQQQLDAWFDPKKYGLWIDGKRVSNEMLRNYKPEDFGHYFVSRLLPNATNYGKHEYQLNLSTVAEFLAWRKRTLESLGLAEKQ